MDKELSYKQIHQIGIQLITLIEKLHEVGYIYNDLKGDNICLTTHDETIAAGQLKLIDFGKCSKYFKSDGNHIANQY